MVAAVRARRHEADLGGGLDLLALCAAQLADGRGISLAQFAAASCASVIVRQSRPVHRLSQP